MIIVKLIVFWMSLILLARPVRMKMIPRFVVERDGFRLPFAPTTSPPFASQDQKHPPLNLDDDPRPSLPTFSRRLARSLSLP